MYVMYDMCSMYVCMYVMLCYVMLCDGKYVKYVMYVCMYACMYVCMNE